MDVEDGDCPACAAVREGGCGDGIIFLECDGTLYRCDVSEWSLGERGLVCVTCEVTTAGEADFELSHIVSSVELEK